MTGVSARVQVGETPRPRKPMPSRVADLAHLQQMIVHLLAGLVHIVSSGAPDSSNWPPGSSETEPRPLGSLKAMMLSPS